jgi:DedD protein
MEQNLKQRLVGAIVLVSLAVIFIPIILEGPDDEWTPRSHSIPEPPQMDYRASMQLPLPTDTVEPAAARAVPADEPDATEPVQTVSTPPAPAAAEPEPGPAPQPEPVAVAKPETVAKPAAAKAAPASDPAALPAGWYAQVGSFSQKMNASGLRDRLKSAGYDARLQATGSSYRVLVGPVKTRVLAEKQRDQLLAGQQLKGIVIQLGG